MLSTELAEQFFLSKTKWRILVVGPSISASKGWHILSLTTRRAVLCVGEGSVLLGIAGDAPQEQSPGDNCAIEKS